MPFQTEISPMGADGFFFDLKPAAGQPIDCHSRQNSQIRRSFGDQVTRSHGESSCLAFASGENSSATETGAVWFFFSPAACVAAAAGTSGARAARPRPAGIERDVGSERHRPTLRPHLRESLRPHRLRRRRRVPPRAPSPRRARRRRGRRRGRTRERTRPLSTSRRWTRRWRSPSTRRCARRGRTARWSTRSVRC